MDRTRLGREFCGRRLVEAQGWEFQPHADVTWFLQELSAPHVALNQIVDLFSRVQKDLTNAWGRAIRLEAIEKEVLLLRQRIGHLEQDRLLSLVVRSLAPEPYRLLRPLEVSVRREEDTYIATFYDANLSASGDTPEEAVMNLKDVVVAAHEALSGLNPEQLGPGPAEQIAVLKEFIEPEQ